MRLSHQIERYLVAEGQTTVTELSRYFGISESRCREELLGLIPFGVQLHDDGAVMTCPLAEPVVAGVSDYSHFAGVLD